LIVIEIRIRRDAGAIGGPIFVEAGKTEGGNNRMWSEIEWLARCFEITHFMTVVQSTNTFEIKSVRIKIISADRL